MFRHRGGLYKFKVVPTFLIALYLNKSLRVIEHFKGFNLTNWTYMWLISSERFTLDKCENIWKNRPFFRANMAGLEKYCTGGYGQIGVFRVKLG